MEYQHIIHPIAPVFDKHSDILILGSLPSVKSREQMFFYGHPQNRFWRVMEALFQSEPLLTVEDKKQFLLAHHIALWDVIYSCDIRGSADSTIRNVEPTDLNRILRHSNVSRVFCNGKTSGNYYDKFQKERTGIEAVTLPSTSPANAAWNLERLVEAWRCIL